MLRQVEHTVSVVICDTNKIFHNGQPSHGGNCKTFDVMTSTLPIGTLAGLGSAAFLTLYQYQGNPNRNHKLWNIISKERYILAYAGAAGRLLHTCINGKFTMGKLISSLLS